MKILLMMPPMSIGENYHTVKHIAPHMPSLGMAYVYSALKEIGVDVDFIDYQCKKVSQEQIIEDCKPYDFVGMQSYVSNINRCFDVAKLIDKPIILGGPHASLFGAHLVNDFHSVIMGEGENIIRRLPFLDRGIYTLPLESNLDNLPLPAYEIFGNDYYPAIHIRGRKVRNIITSRGCPYSCTFCSASEIYGHKYRYQSIERTIKEMKILKNMGVDSLQIYDDNFTTNKKRTKELCKAMIKENLKLQWCCYTRADALNDGEMLESMKSSGCYLIVVGIENGNPRVLKEMDKRLDLDKARQGLELVREIGINSLSSFMIGFPSETMEEVKSNIEYSRTLPLDYATYPIFTPYPGNRAYEQALKHGEILTSLLDNYSRWGDGVYLEKGIPRGWYKQMQYKAFVRFYLRPKIMWNMLKELFRGYFIRLFFKLSI